MIILNTFSIALCDDDPVIHRIVLQNIESFYKSKNISVNIQSYYHAMNILNDAKKHQVVLMDIDFPDIDGIEVAKRLKIIHPNIQIIMLTSKVERFKDGYRIGACRFVTKPIDQEELLEALEYTRNKQVSLPDLCVVMKGDIYHIHQQDIILIEVDRNKTFIHTMNHVFTINTTLKNIKNQLDRRFFVQVHKSYIVNMMFIVEVNNGEVHMSNGFKALLSYRRKKEVINQWMRFDLGRGSL